MSVNPNPYRKTVFIGGKGPVRHIPQYILDEIDYAKKEREAGRNPYKNKNNLR